MKKWYLAGFITLIVIIAFHVSFVQPQSLLTLREILNKVYDPSLGRLRTTVWSGPAVAAQLTETEIFNKVYDASGNRLLISGDIGYTAENVANKDTNIILGNSDILYPSQRAVKLYVDSSIKIMSNTRLVERGCTQTDTTPITVNADNCDFVDITELSQATTFNAPTGTHFNGDFLTFVIFTTTARALTFSTGTNGFSAENGITLPVISIAGKYVLYGFRWNAGSSKWALTATTQAAFARGITFEIGDPAGSTLTVASTTTAYVTVPLACTISAYNLLIDAGTITVKFWKVATGTVIPTSSNSINTSGVGISTGTAIHSTTVSDFTSTAIAKDDILAMNVTAVTTAKYISATLQCDS